MSQEDFGIKRFTDYSDKQDEQISALQAQVARLTADLAICRQHDSGMVDSAEGLHVLLSKISQERDALKRENEALLQEMREALEGMVAFEARALSHHRHREPLSVALDMRMMIDRILNVLRAREALDAAKEPHAS
jgi:hypothetical protein